MTAQRKIVEDDDPLDHARQVRGAIDALLPMAIAACSPANILETMRKWVAHANFDFDGAGMIALTAEAMALASEAAIFTPSMSGTRPIDRLARQFKAGSPADAAAIEYLKSAKFTLFRIFPSRAGEIFTARDLASGENFQLYEASLSELAFDRGIGARLCRIDRGLHAMCGPMLPLDDVVNAAAKEFIRPGKGLANDQRCAGAVYRAHVRHGAIGQLDFGIERRDVKGARLSYPEKDLDALVQHWLHFGDGATPTGDALAEARNLASGPRILAAIASCIELRRAGQGERAAIYREVAFIQMETLHLRSGAGSGEANAIEILRGLLNRQIGRGALPSGAADLYAELCARLPRPRAAAKDDELTRVIERIRALRAKTTDQGCTEQEALAAAAKVAEMLERYGLSLSEVEIRKQACEGFGVDTGRRKQGPSDRCVPSIAEFCDCRAWSETSATGTLRFVFFGLPADVEAAHYLYDLVNLAFEGETLAFKSGAIHATMLGAEKRHSVTSFQIGLANGILTKLAALKAERVAAMFKSSGRDLVPVKAAVVDEEFDKLGLSLHSKRLKRRRKVLATSYEAGRVAGGQFEVHRGLR